MFASEIVDFKGMEGRMTFTESDFETITTCPWCQSSEAEEAYEADNQAPVVHCLQCGVFYAKQRLNAQGLIKYWDNYLNTTHRSDQGLFDNRQIMYDLDYKYISKFITHHKKVLDIGCSDGLFLDYFHRDGFTCFGVEFGHEAATEAAKKYQVWEGEFPKLEIAEKFDLIIFRGTFQYFTRPAKYLEKAVSLLGDNGMIYITAQPNMDSFGHRLYGNRFSQPISFTDFTGFTPDVFANFLQQYGIQLVGEKYFYEETPYADIEKDILKVADVIEKKAQGIALTDERCPAFWGNMMTLVFQKYGIKA